MKRLILSAAAALCCLTLSPGVARADDGLKRIQQSLRDQGFYYGSIDGAPGDETTQAIRRYQIRNGLQVTGQLNDETRNSILRASGDAGTAPAGVSVAPSGAVRPRSTPSAIAQPTPRSATNSAPPPASRVAPTPSVSDDDAADAGGFHRSAAGQATPPPLARTAPVRPVPPETIDGGDVPDDRPLARSAAPVPPAQAQAPSPDARQANGAGTLPPNAVAPSPRLSAVFANTPYEFAPPPVQAGILRRAQNKLLRQGYYDQDPDGRPNALTVEALTNFQGFNRLRRTGRLDVETLAALRLLPGNLRGYPAGSVEDGPRRAAGPYGGVYEGRVVQ
jgi:peptidoglycan hydrolase-like protein with peptidoglycan-binding domain